MSGNSLQRIRSAPTSHDDFDRGVRAIVNAVRPTLGPIPRTVAVARAVRTMAPELLDDGASIARRITALSNVHDDPGAMYLRGLLYRIGEEVGDGTATAATLFSAVLAGGRRAVGAGIPAQPLRAHLDRLGDRVFEAIMIQARPGLSQDTLTKVARSACHDAELAELLGDAFDVVGDTGQVDLRPSRRKESWREFVQGSYWESGLLSEATFGDPARQRTDMYDAAIVITNLPIDDPGEMVGVLEAVRARPVGGLLIVARSLAPAVAGLLHANSVPGKCPIVAVKTPVHGQRGAIDDLAALTGGRPFLKEAGDSLRSFSSDDFGQARTAWATRQQFGLMGGRGDPQAVRSHTETLRGSHRSAGDKEARRELLQRLGKLQGTSATLWIGANSDLEAKNRMAAAGRAAQTLRLALRDGVVPGGGAALLHCQDALSERLASSGDEIDQTALRIVIDALRTPAEALLTNRGHEPAPVIDCIRRDGAPTGYDVMRGCFGDMHAMGLVDPARVVATATRTAVRGAALALTIDVIVHTHSTEASTTPE